MTGKKKVYVGTSGWHYGHWSGSFYPSDLPKSRFFDYYAECFHTAEINNSFYQLPAEKTLANWRDSAPEGFFFAAKASRYITHMKKLKDPGKPVKQFLDRMGALEDKLGPILFQLPPKWKCNPERLESFVEGLPEGYRFAFEFRDTSWFDDETYRILSDNNAAFCIYELDGMLSPKEITADFVYVRLHGPEGPYQGSYDPKTLNGWANTFAKWARQGRDIYCYFDNDEAGYAAINAYELYKKVQKKK